MVLVLLLFAGVTGAAQLQVPAGLPLDRSEVEWSGVKTRRREGLGQVMGHITPLPYCKDLLPRSSAVSHLYNPAGPRYPPNMLKGCALGPSAAAGAAPGAWAARHRVQGQCT